MFHIVNLSKGSHRKDQIEWDLLHQFFHTVLGMTRGELIKRLESFSIGLDIKDPFAVACHQQQTNALIDGQIIKQGGSR